VILAELEIQNYKQYAGEHRFEFPATGIIAIIGPNGGGKTTLFEAIEWCLYNPSTIANDDVPPRAGVGHTRVRVVLEDTRDATRFVVERTLRRKSAQGQIYRADQPDSPLVQGSKQITDYVTRHLVGLSHRAFVSTFFTRQKELSFFGTMKETDRRVAVGRLLGLETIREAQTQIGEERKLARADAISYRTQHEEQSAGRDFAAERTTVEAEITATADAVAVATTRLTAATAHHTRARGELDRWRELERRDASFAQTGERLQGDERTATARRNAARDALKHLDEAAVTRDRLIPEANVGPERQAAVARHEAERERFQQHQQADENRDRATRMIETIVRNLQRTVTEIPASEIAAWRWTATDAADPIGTARRLVDAIEALDVDSVTTRAEVLATALNRASQRNEAEVTHRRYHGLLEKLQAERAVLAWTDDVEAEIARARRQRDEALARAEAARTTALAAENTRRKQLATVDTLKKNLQEGACPTCGRLLGEEEATFVIETLEDRIAELVAEAAASGQVQRQAKAEAEAAERREGELTARAKQITTLDGRIADGLTKVQEAAETFERLAADCATARTAHDLAADPTTADVTRAQQRATLYQRLAHTSGQVRDYEQAAREAAAERQRADVALTEIGAVNYDPAAHVAAQNALTESRTAAARIGQIESDLARRPGHEADLATATSEMARLATERATLDAERASLGFDAEALRQAINAEAAALAAGQAAREDLAQAQIAARDATQRRDALVADEARIAGLATTADARGRAADELDRMYREFTRFDQYVAGRVTPHLADHASELLQSITDGKYDRVLFDENYGLMIYDGDDPVPVERFSGGERDVAALAARLALSRLVGGQAARPPSFLVLDEVFGSLDADRRAQVLATLSNLSASTEAFRQLFIISHVDDVRLSSIFNEIWRISDVDGVSHFENITRAGGFADL